jgi:hypothetical protein
LAKDAQTNQDRAENRGGSSAWRNYGSSSRLTTLRSRHDASDQTAVTFNVDNVPSRDSVEVRRGIVT